MGFTDAEVIEDGANYLLSILTKESEVRFSRFYDGSEETANRLADGLGFDEDDRSWYCAEHVMDLAIGELAKQGIVSSEELEDLLSDGTKDYKIFLTERGKQHLVTPFELKFWAAE